MEIIGGPVRLYGPDGLPILTTGQALNVNTRQSTAADIVTAIPRAAVVLLDTTTVTAQTVTYTGPDIACSGYLYVSCDINFTVVTLAGATIQALLQRKFRDGTYGTLPQIATVGAAGPVLLDVGPGIANASNAVARIPGDTIRLVVTITGGTTPTMSFAYSVKAM